MSPVRNARLAHTYRDSVVLMQLSRELSGRPGVSEAAVMMGTPANVAVLAESGLLALAPEEVVPDDVVLAVSAASVQEAEAAIEWARAALQSAAAPAEGGGVLAVAEPAYKGWRGIPTDAQLALISTPGPYAAAEAWKALKLGLDVFLFSDHVAIEDEIALKRAGRERGRLVMGPECGTAIVNGVPLGFANEVRRGTIGVAAASGSGLQEVVCLIDRLGSGISHAIGTGGRDLRAEVGGLAMQQAIALLLEDQATEVLVVLSKPPAPAVAATILEQLQAAAKPAVVCFIGADPATISAAGLTPAATLEEAAQRAVELAGSPPAADVASLAVEGSPAQGRLLRGLFSGGTLAYEAMTVLAGLLGPVWSNAPLDPAFRLQSSALPAAHVCLDLGSEEYTSGKPHPMLDATSRTELVLECAGDPRVGVILLDLVLGYGCHPDPAGALLPAIEEARRRAQRGGWALFFVASVIGTDRDVQAREAQVARLRAGGVLVAPTNAAAARTAAQLLGPIPTPT